MECPLGSSVTETQHEVKTLSKAREWFSDVRERDLPISISQFTAKNGRCMIKVRDKRNKIIHQRG